MNAIIIIIIIAIMLHGVHNAQNVMPGIKDSGLGLNCLFTV